MKQEETRKHIKLEVIELPYAYHGGAWKVAYADFMTAMMAFFLLMWLLNMTPQIVKEELADYFNPTAPMASDSKSGAGGVLGGLTMSPEGARASDKDPTIPMQRSNLRKRGGDYQSKVHEYTKTAQQKKFEDAAKQIKRTVNENKDLKKYKDNIEISVTPEGLKIDILDKEKESMFPSGSANMYERARELLANIADVILEMPNMLSIRGHTDGARYSKEATYTNWELSADRANAVRRAVLDAGFPPERLHDVMGKADTEPFIEDNPLDPRNRRITMLLLNQELPPDVTEDEEGDVAAEELIDGTEFLDFDGEEDDINPYQKTPGEVEFP